jgi:hypothetical protein
MELDTKGSRYLQHRSKARIPIYAECLVQTLATETGILCDLRHPFGAGNVTKRSGDARRIVGRFRQPGIEIPSHFSRAPKLCRNIIRNSLGLRRFPFPSGSPSWDEFEKMTWEQIEEGAIASKPGFKVVHKLLTDKRFDR